MKRSRHHKQVIAHLQQYLVDHPEVIVYVVDENDGFTVEEVTRVVLDAHLDASLVDLKTARDFALIQSSSKPLVRLRALCVVPKRVYCYMENSEQVFFKKVAFVDRDFRPKK